MAKIPKINDQNEVIGETTIREAKERGWPRRIAKVIVRDENGKILLQKRSKKVHAWPGRWDVCGGHVDLGETYVEAGVREMNEELGIMAHVCDTGEIVYSQDENIFFGICTATIKNDVRMHLEVEEVESVRWIYPSDFGAEIAADANAFVPILVEVWQNYRDKLIR